MELTAVIGVLVVVMAGLAIGTSPWPLKLMHRFQYEHWAFVAMFVGLIVAQRNYEVNSRAIRVSDEMLQEVNQLVR